MRKIILSLFIVLISAFAVGHGYGLYQDFVSAEDNTFYSGSFNLQISSTDSDGDNIAESSPQSNWSSNTQQTWASSAYWKPGESVSSAIFLRNAGNIDAESVWLNLSGRSYFGTGGHLDEVINLTQAWYDRNGDGIQDEGEDILPELIAAYDTNGGSFTLLDFYSGTDLAHYGVPFDLEGGEAILPGEKTDSALGGLPGSGKGLFMTWEFDPESGENYGDSVINFDLEFTAEQVVN